MLRPLRVALASALALASVLVAATATPAHASSAAGILNNAWIITELGGQALSTQAELSPYEKGLATTATTGTVATSGLSKVPRAGALGMVLNTVGVLGGLAFAFGGEDEAPALPMPVGPEGGVVGDPVCGYLTGGMVINPTCTIVGTGSNRFNRFGGLWTNPFNKGYSWPGTSPNTSYVIVDTQVAGVDVNTFPATGDSSPGTNRWTFTNTDAPGRTISSSISGALATGTDHTFTQWVVPGISYGFSGQSKMVPSLAVKVGQITIPKFGGLAVDPGVETDPALVPRYIDSSITCKSAGGGSEVFTRRDGPIYISPGVTTPQVPDMTCPDGTWLAEGTRDLATEGTDETLPLQEPYVAPPWVEEQVTAFPECYPATTTRCTLAVYRTAPAPAVDCGAYSIGSANPCADWWTDPKRSEKYECRFGATPVAMRRCSPYADTFSVGTVAPSDPDPDAEVTDPTPGVDPTPEATPNLGGCVPNWGLELLNPWWVFKAQACALQWAFVPQTSLQTRVTAVKQQLEYRVPFVWFDGFLTIPAAVPFGGCPDWRIKIPGPGESTALDQNVVCDSSYTDALRTARPVLLVFMASLAFWPMIRSIGYASFPIIKPVPGGGR